MSGPFPKNVTQLSVQPTEFTGVSGDTVRFECNILSGPGNRVNWIRGGNRPLPPSATIRDGVLVIFNAAPPDSGSYICQAVDEYGLVVGESVSVVVNIIRSGRPPLLKIEPERQTVSQGTLAVVRCVSVTDPDIPVVWSKVNDQLSSHVQIVGPELRIPQVQIKDRGVYVCRATNDGGSSQASAVIEVERREPPAVELYPKVKQSVIEGGSALLQCRITAGIPTPSVRWYRARNDSFTGHVEILPAGVLRFTGVNIADEGEYTCNAQNDAGTTEAIAVLEVLSFPVITLNPSGPLSVSAGQRVHLECNAKGKPFPFVTWQKYTPGYVPYSAFETRTNTVGTPHMAVYEINNVQEADAGTYTCSAVNDAGVTEERLQLIVTDEGNDIEPSIRPGGDLAPSTLPDEEFVFPVGSTATIRCDAGPGTESIYINWVRGDGSTISAQHDVRNGALIIYNIKRADAGKYTCVGIGPSGVTLFAKSSNIRVADPPHITLHPPVQVVKPGDSPFVTCSAQGEEPITITWSTASGTPLPYSVTTEKGHLQFRGITVYDAGKYVCKARNLAGEAEAVAEVIVNAAARPARPVIRAEDRSQFAFEGSDLDLKCAVDTVGPEYRITWSRENNELPRNSRVVGDTLHLYNLRSEYSGRYICRISSPFGSSMDYIDLQVERTCLQDEFRCSNGQCIMTTQYCDGIQHCADNSDEIDCHKYRRGTSNVTIDIEANQEQVKVGDSVVVQCNVNGDADANITWSKVGGKMGSNVFVDGNVLRISDVQISNGGFYKCTAITKDGPRYDHYNLAIQLSDASDAITAVETKKVPYGKDADLNCTTNLEPPVNYSWTLRTYDHSQWKTVDSKILYLHNVTSNDSGLHICTASSDKYRVNIPVALIVTDVIPQFSGASYVALPPLYASYLKFDIEISFKPYSENGLLIYDSQERKASGDFISLTLKDSVPEFRFDLGSGPAVIKSDFPLHMNEWHTIRIVRNKREGVMEVNGVNFTGVSPGNFQRLDLKIPLFIGGVPHYDSYHAFNVTDVLDGFRGCISYLLVNEKLVNLKSDPIEKNDLSSCDSCAVNPCLNDGICQEVPTKSAYTCICPPGFVGKNCNKPGDSCYPDTCGKGRCLEVDGNVECLCPLGKIGKRCKKDIKVKVTAFNRHSYLAYAVPNIKKRFKLMMKIKPASDTDIQDSLLLYSAENHNGDGNYVAITVEDRHLIFKLNMDSKSLSIRSRRELVPGEYVTIIAVIDNKEVKFYIQDEVITENVSPSDQDEDEEDQLLLNEPIKLRTPLYVGGYDKQNIKLPADIATTTGFYGCVLELQMSDMQVNLLQTFAEAANVYDCYTLFGDPCNGNPCRNGAACIATKNDYTCQCLPGFSGKDCEKEQNICEVLTPCTNGGVCVVESGTYSCDCPSGFGGHICESRLSTSLSFEGSGFVKLPGDVVTHDELEETITFTFSTISDSGLLLWHGGNQSEELPKEDFLALAVENGYIVMSYNAGSKTKVIKATDHKVSDGSVHSVSVRRHDREVNLELDRETTEIVVLDDYLDIDDYAFLGGVPSIEATTGGRYKEGFKGCIHSFSLKNATLVDFGQLAISTRDTNHCTL